MNDRRHRLGWWVALPLAAAVLLGACGEDEEEKATTTESRITVQAGMNDVDDPNVAVLEYLPESITVTEGTTVEWQTPGPEPHSVTFLPNGEQPPAPGTPEREALNAPTPPAKPYDGTSLVNSGLVPLGPQKADPFRLAFGKAGDYSYFCSIHPLMTGTVKVVAEGGEADSADEVRSRGRKERDRWLEEGRKAKADLVAKAPRSEPGPGGTTTWYVEMGVTTEHTDILAFAPTPKEVAAGDRVVFVNNSLAPHTATFESPPELLQNPTSPQAMAPAPGPSPQAVAAGVLVNTGFLPPNAPPGAGPPEAARSFTVTFGEPGSYRYVCLLHVPSAMGGELEVG